MKKRMILAAMIAALAMMAGACSGGADAETTAAETETGAEAEGASEETAEPETVAVDYSVGLKDDGYLDGIKPEEYITLADYKNCVLEKDSVTVTDEEVQTYIDNMMEQYTEDRQVTDRAVEDGDSINLDYVGSVDGVEFEGGNTQGSGTDLVIGSGSYIDDFEQQLIGHKPGENVTVNVTFPEDYGKDELNGKDAVFECTINYINEPVVPELTDAFVAENMQEGYEVSTVAELKQKITDDIQDEKNYTEVWTWLLDNTTFNKEPETVVDGILQTYVNEATNYALQYGMSLDDYLAAMGVENEEAFRDNYRETVVTFSHRYLITQAICEAEDMPCDEDALEEYFSGEDYSEYVDYFGSGYVKMQVNFQRVCDKVLEYATIQ